MLSKQLIESDPQWLKPVPVETFLHSFIDRSVIPKSIFIHIPKCAGSTIRNNFHTISSHEYHATVTTFIEAFECTSSGKGFDEFLSRNPFTIVRNPFDRIVSWFFYHRSAIWSHGRYNYKFEPIYNASTTDPQVAFEEWILNRCPTHWGEIFRLKNSESSNKMPATQRGFRVPGNHNYHVGWSIITRLQFLLIILLDMKN
jgi:hypothetical protein